MKKIILSLCFLGMALLSNAQWNFKFKFSTMSGTPIITTPVSSFPTIGQGFKQIGVIDLSNYVCEGGQFRLENLSGGSHNCTFNHTIFMSGSQATKWDAVFGEIIPSISNSAPQFTMSTSYLLNEQIWPVSPGLIVTMPINNAPYLSNTNNDANFVYYQLAIAPHMGCFYGGVYNSSAGCNNFVYFKIKVKRAPKPLNDINICPGTAVTNAVIGLPPDVTITSWAPSNPITTSPASTTNYTIGLSNGSCAINDALKITVNQPVLELFPSSPIVVCAGMGPVIGNDVTDKAERITVVNNSSNTSMIVFNSLTGLMNMNYFTRDYEFMLSTPGSYTVIYDYRNALNNTICSKSYNVTILRPVIFPNYSRTMCNTNFQQICAPTAPVGSTYSYKWTKSDVQFVLSMQQCYTPTAFGNYTLRITDQNGCESYSNFVISLSPSATPNANFNLIGDISGNFVTYVATPVASNTQNTWLLMNSNAAGDDGTPIQTIASGPGASVTFNQLAINQYYKIKYTTSTSPCNIAASSSYVERTALGGKLFRADTLISSVTENAKYQELTVYPNPGTGLFTVQTLRGKEASIEVFDVTGRKVKTAILYADSDKFELDLTGFKKGIYFLNYVSTDQLYSKKIILE